MDGDYIVIVGDLNGHVGENSYGNQHHRFKRQRKVCTDCLVLPVGHYGSEYWRLPRIINVASRLWRGRCCARSMA